VISGTTIWFTGLSGSGKSTVAHLSQQLIEAANLPVELLDGDVVRQHLSTGLGFSKEDRDINIRRIAWVAALLNRHGVHCITAAISPYRALRDEVRALIPRFVEVFCDAPLDVLIKRDPKALYKRAIAGEIKNFTGISDPYEPPPAPEVHLLTDRTTPEHCAATVIRTTEILGYLPAGIANTAALDAAIILHLRQHQRYRVTQ
jgi:adenylyl-sulfate kinase